MTWEQWQKYDIRALLWTMDARNARIERSILNLTSMVQQLTGMENTEMTALDDVKAEIAATRTEVANTDGNVASAVALIHRLMDMVGNAAATATDLQGLQTDIAAIRGQVKAEADTLGAAVAAGPTA